MDFVLRIQMRGAVDNETVSLVDFVGLRPFSRPNCNFCAQTEHFCRQAITQMQTLPNVVNSKEQKAFLVKLKEFVT